MFAFSCVLSKNYLLLNALVQCSTSSAIVCVTFATLFDRLLPFLFMKFNKTDHCPGYSVSYFIILKSLS